MKHVIVHIPDNFYNSFVDYLKQIPGVSVEDAEKDNASNWHNPILEERIEEYKKNSQQGKDWDDFEKELDKI